VKTIIEQSTFKTSNYIQNLNMFNIFKKNKNKSNGNTFLDRWKSILSDMGYSENQIYGLAFHTGAFHFRNQIIKGERDSNMWSTVAPFPFTLERYGNYNDKPLNDILCSLSKILDKEMNNQDFDEGLADLFEGKAYSYDYDSDIDLNLDNYLTTKSLTLQYHNVLEKIGYYLKNYGNSMSECYGIAWTYFTELIQLDQDTTLKILHLLQFDSIPSIKTAIMYPQLYYGKKSAIDDFHWSSYILQFVISIHDPEYDKNNYTLPVWKMHFSYFMKTQNSLNPWIKKTMMSPDLTINIISQMTKIKTSIEHPSGSLPDYSQYSKHPNPSIVGANIDPEDITLNVQDMLEKHDYYLLDINDNAAHQMQFNMLTFFYTTLFALSN